MCDRGSTVDVPVAVPHPANTVMVGVPSASTQLVPIDSCIAPIVAGLQAAQVFTEWSCCGHGQHTGYISLHDGRCLVVLSPEQHAIYKLSPRPGPIEKALAIKS